MRRRCSAGRCRCNCGCRPGNRHRTTSLAERTRRGRSSCRWDRLRRSSPRRTDRGAAGRNRTGAAALRAMRDVGVRDALAATEMGARHAAARVHSGGTAGHRGRHRNRSHLRYQWASRSALPAPPSMATEPLSTPPSGAFQVGRGGRQAISNAGVSQINERARSEAPGLVIVLSLSVRDGSGASRRGPAQRQRMVGLEVARVNEQTRGDARMCLRAPGPLREAQDAGRLVRAERRRSGKERADERSTASLAAPLDS